MTQEAEKNECCSKEMKVVSDDDELHSKNNAVINGEMIAAQTTVNTTTDNNIVMTNNLEEEKIILYARKTNIVLRVILEQYERLKIFYTDPDLEGGDIEPLRINSEWTPKSIPQEITRRIDDFSNAICRTYIPRRGISNISSHQAQVLQSICENENIVILHADKNLGPAAFDTIDYIRRALYDHLLVTNTYILVPEDDALTAISDLNLEIFRWT
jgi:hypothetical protein